jgi:hypothetical protein
VGGTCSTNGEKTDVYRLLIGKSEGKRPPERPKLGWIDSKMDLLRYRIGWCGLDWSGSYRYSWGALVNAVMNLRVP